MPGATEDFVTGGRVHSIVALHTESVPSEIFFDRQFDPAQLT